MSKTILIADDDMTIMKLFSLNMELNESDIHIHTAENGQDAIDYIEREKPSVLVLDIRMPKSDGFAVLEHLKKNGHEIPTVILTNYRNPEYVEKCERYGVHEYLIKHEHRMDSIVEKVTSYLA